MYTHIPSVATPLVVVVVVVVVVVTIDRLNR